MCNSRPEEEVKVSAPVLASRGKPKKSKVSASKEAKSDVVVVDALSDSDVVSSLVPCPAAKY